VARWHPAFSAVTLADGRVASASGLAGPGVTAGAAGLGPLALTDALGRPFWRFAGAEYLDVGAGLTFSNRNVSAFAVVRGGGGGIFGLGNRTGYGGGSTAVNTGGTLLDTGASPVAPFLRAFSRGADGDAVNRQNVVLTPGLQVAGGTSRTTAAGGIRLSINAAPAANVAQSSVAASGVAGAEIGRYPYTPGTSGSWTKMDLYELVVFSPALTNSEHDAVAAALTAHYAIPAITGQIVLEGDSISAGAGIPNFWETPAWVLTEPGAGRIPAGWRVVPQAISGNQVSHLVTRRDTANGWPAMKLPGDDNIVAFEIGRNDMSGSITAAQHYANVVAWLNTADTGVLQRGWRVRSLVNIASSSSLMAKIDEYRGLLRNPLFLTDTLTGAGQAYQGRLALVDTDLIEDAPANTVFLTTADAADGTYYQGDSTHPNALGALLRLTGGTVPARGLAHGLA